MKLNKKADPVLPVLPEKPEDPSGQPGTVLAEGVLFQGDFQAREPMLIHGSVEGHIRSTSHVTLTGLSSCTGEISSENLLISGKALGNILCSNTVEMAGAGRIEGDLQAARFIMSEDSLFEGNLQIKKPGAPKKGSAGEAARTNPAEEKKV